MVLFIRFLCKKVLFVKVLALNKFQDLHLFKLAYKTQNEIFDEVDHPVSSIHLVL